MITSNFPEGIVDDQIQYFKYWYGAESHQQTHETAEVTWVEKKPYSPPGIHSAKKYELRLGHE